MSYWPEYSTSYGEDFGYNSRRGSNNSDFRNRYLNPTYRTPTCRHGVREEFAPQGNPYGTYVGMQKQQQRPSTVPINTTSRAGSQIMASQPPTSARTLAQTQGPPSNTQRPVSAGSDVSDYPSFLPKQYHIVPVRPRTPIISRPGLTQDFKESKSNFGKFSVSRRLPEQERLRYHVPGYMGFVKNIQFLHGNTYGKTTRQCVMTPAV